MGGGKPSSCAGGGGGGGGGEGGGGLGGKNCQRDTRVHVCPFHFVSSCGNWNLDRPLFGLLSPFIVRHREERVLVGLLSLPSLDGRLGGKVMYETSFILDIRAACLLACLLCSLYGCVGCVNNRITVD
jgi:hypothetical protein